MKASCLVILYNDLSHMSYCNVQDWVIAVDSLDTTWGAHTISERLDYAIPVMLALREAFI